MQRDVQFSETDVLVPPSWWRRQPVVVRVATVLGLGIGVAVLVGALVVALSPGPRNAAATAQYLAPLPAKSHHHKHHSDSDDSGGSDGSDGSDGVSSQTQTTDGDTQTNSGCSKTIHSLGDLDSALDQAGDGPQGAICVQMNNQSVNNSVGRINGGSAGSDYSPGSDLGDLFSDDPDDD